MVPMLNAYIGIGIYLETVMQFSFKVQYMKVHKDFIFDITEFYMLHIFLCDWSH